MARSFKADVIALLPGPDTPAQRKRDRHVFYGVTIYLTLLACGLALNAGQHPSERGGWQALALIALSGVPVAFLIYKWKRQVATVLVLPLAFTVVLATRAAVTGARLFARITRWAEWNEARARFIEHLGRLARFLFFVAVAGAIWLFAEAWQPKDILNIPFAQLTPGMLLDAAARLLSLICVGMLWFKWAFSDSPNKPYAFWGYAGLTTAALAVTIWMFTPL